MKSFIWKPKVSIERKGCVNFWHHQHGVSYTLRPSTEACNMARRGEGLIGDLTTVKRLHTTGRAAERYGLSDAGLERRDRSRRLV